MNNKILALIIIVLAGVAIYGAVYAAVTTIIMPMDSQSLAGELKSVDLSINNSDNIAEMELQSNQNIPLNYMSQSQRTEIANNLRGASQFTGSGQDWDSYNSFNGFKIFLYNLILRGDIANQMNNITATHTELLRLNNETSSIMKQMANDIEKGNGNSYANDLKNLSNNVKSYDNSTAKLKTQLKDAIQLLGG